MGVKEEIDEKNIGIQKVLEQLEYFSKEFLERGEYYEPSKKELDFYQNSHVNFISAMYQPHDYQYEAILEMVKKDDIIIDMGSGDFRLPLLLSQKVKKVYALELDPYLVSKVLDIINFNLPSNLIIICADWYNFLIPNDVSLIICLCNSPIIPDEWYNYKTIIGTTLELGFLNNNKKIDK